MSHHSLCRMVGHLTADCPQCEALRRHDRFAEAAGVVATPETPLHLSGQLEGMQITGVVMGPDGLPERIELRLHGLGDVTEYRTFCLPSVLR